VGPGDTVISAGPVLEHMPGKAHWQDLYNYSRNSMAKPGVLSNIKTRGFLNKEVFGVKNLLTNALEVY
jgi:hypothetical protein